MTRIRFRAYVKNLLRKLINKVNNFKRTAKMIFISEMLTEQVSETGKDFQFLLLSCTQWELG